MRPDLKRNSFLLFLTGAFSLTQVHFIGNIGISEAVSLLVFPFIFFKELPALRKNGFRPVLTLLFLTIIGCCVGSLMNHTYLFDFLRGVASPIALFVNIVVVHSLLRKNLSGFKWLILGLALTNFLNIYAFQTGQSGDGAVNGEYGDAAEIIMSNALFWVSRIKALLMIPIQGWYLQTPLLYSIVAPFALAAYAILTTASGRSSSVIAMSASLLILIGRKRISLMRSIQRNFVFFVLFGVAAIFAMKTAYQYLALNGTLGEKAREKYERQTKGKTGILPLLMGGRREFFVGLFAALDHPIIGVGPWALDTERYNERFLFKYGTDEDMSTYVLQMRNAQKDGRDLWCGYLPSHSYIIGFWLWYGIFGLLFWLYVLYLMLMLFKNYIAVVPQWYGFYSVAMPSLFWNILFSPFAGRTYVATCITLLLLSKAIAQRRIVLPMDMCVELNRAK